MLTTHDIARLLVPVTAAYGERFQHLGDVTVAAWRHFIGHLPYRVAELAIDRAIRRSPYPPTPHDVLREAAELLLPEDARLSPAEAWGLVLAEVRRTGVHGRPNLPGLVGRAVDIVGWREICTSEHVDVVRAQFCRVFEQLVQRTRDELALARALPPWAAERAAELTGARYPALEEVR